jgi:hypothetical protein
LSLVLYYLICAPPTHAMNSAVPGGGKSLASREDFIVMSSFSIS